MKNYQKIAEGLEKQVKALRQQKRELKLINVLQKEALFELMPHNFPALNEDELAMVATASNHLPDEQWEQFQQLRDVIKQDTSEKIVPEYGTEAYWLWQLNNNPQAGSYEAKMLYCLYEDIPDGVSAEEWVNITQLT